LQHNCEWNRWRGEFVLEHSSSETQSISNAIERWSVQHRAFAVETYFKNNDSVLTQRIFCRHFNIQPRTTVDLKLNIREEVTAIFSNMLKRVMQNFQKRLGECVDNKGRHLTDTMFRK
jgi:hypothetical protein